MDSEAGTVVKFEVGVHDSGPKATLALNLAYAGLAPN